MNHKTELLDAVTSKPPGILFGALTHVLRSSLLAGALVLASACSLTGHPTDRSADANATASKSALWIKGAAADFSRSGETESVGTELTSMATVTVLPGDRLSSIARRLTGSSSDWKKIAVYNNLANPDSIRAGDVLQVPPELVTLGQTEDFTDPKALSLLAAVQRAQTNDSTFRIAQTSFDIAQLDLPVAQSTLKPQAAASLSAGYTDLFESQIDPYSDQEIALTLSQSLFDRAAAKKVAQARRTGSIAQIELLANQEDLVIRVSEAYFNVLRSTAELEFRESDLGAIRRQLQQTQRRFDVGEIAVTDVVEAKALRDLALAAEIEARNALANSQEVLAEITNYASLKKLLTLQKDIPLPPPNPADIDHWLESANQNNTQVTLARSRRELADEQVEVARAVRLPTVGLNGTFSSSNSGSDLAGGGERANIEIALQVPILTGGLINSQVSQEKLRARQAAEQLEAAERSARRTTRSAFRDVQANISRVNALSQALVSTRLAATATRAGYDAGTRTSVELLTTQRDTFRAQADYASARYDYLLSVLNLNRNSGLLEAGDIIAINSMLQ